MKIIFYNIVSLVLGLILAYYAITTIVKRNKKLFGILSLVIAVLFEGFGVFGFCLPKEYEEYSIIVILGMLVCAIFEIILFLTLNKKEEVKRNGNKEEKKKEEDD